MSRAIDLSNQTFGRLAVRYACRAPDGRRMWWCECRCGAGLAVSATNLRSARQQSCGCLQDDRRAARKLAGTALNSPEYRTWQHMVRRCHGPSQAPDFARYGGVGIAVCPRWRAGQSGKSGFECFLADMGLRPSHKHRLIRREQTQDYRPGNCVWALNGEQSVVRDAGIVHQGQRMTITAALGLVGKGWSAYYRLRDGGFSPQTAIERLAAEAQAQKNPPPGEGRGVQEELVLRV